MAGSVRSSFGSMAEVAFLDADSGKTIRRITVPDNIPTVDKLEISANQSEIYATYTDKVTRTWNAQTGELKKEKSTPETKHEQKKQLSLYLMMVC